MSADATAPESPVQLVERLRAALDDREVRLRAALNEGTTQGTQRIAQLHEQLRTIQAHREILRLHEAINVWPEGTEGAKFYTGSKRVCRSCDERTDTPCPTVRSLACIYFPEARAPDGG